MDIGHAFAEHKRTLRISISLEYRIRNRLKRERKQLNAYIYIYTIKINNFNKTKRVLIWPWLWLRHWIVFQVRWRAAWNGRRLLQACTFRVLVFSLIVSRGTWTAFGSFLSSQQRDALLSSRCCCDAAAPAIDERNADECVRTCDCLANTNVFSVVFFLHLFILLASCRV